MNKAILLFLAFTVIPALELGLLVWIGQFIGPLATVGIVVTTGAIGAWLAKREGFGVLRKLQEESRQGFPSGDRLVEGLLVLIGGVLLITPGVLTDFVGFSLMAPPTRRWIAPRVKRAILKRVGFVPMGGDGPDKTVYGDRPMRDRDRPHPSPKGPFDHPGA